MKRYVAKEVNGKGYIYDTQSCLGMRLPIAVEKSIEFAERQVEKFNREEEAE